MHRKHPRFQLAQRGSFFLQSTHTLLSGDLTRARRILALASVCWRDCVGRDIVAAPSRFRSEFFVSLFDFWKSAEDVDSRRCRSSEVVSQWIRRG